MNENHNHDKELLEKVERLINSGEPSGSRLLDDLAAMKPRAKADFQQDLENRLLASFYTRQQETKETPELTTLTLKPEVKSGTRRLASLPVTLAAAVAAVLMMSVVLFMGSTPGGFFANSGVAQAATFTPTSQPTSTPVQANVVISDEQFTATAIIAGATQTVEALAVPFVDDVQLTATAIIAGATQTVAASAFVTEDQIYVVQPGDSLAEVAARFGVDPSVIVEANGIEDPNMVQVGDELIIPAPFATPVPIPEGELQPVVIALQDIRQASVITANMLAVVYYPVDIVPMGVLSDPALAVDMIVDEAIARYQPVLTDNLVSSSPPDISALVPQGMVAVAIPITMLGDTASAIQEGDVAKFILPSLTIEGVQIILIGDTVGDSENPDIITVAMLPADAVALTSAIETTPSLVIGVEIQTGLIFEYGGHVTSTETTATSLMREAGMTWMKIQVDYTPGMDTAPIALAINHAHANGFRILLTIVGNPVDMTAEGYVEQYAAFLGEIAALNPNAIEVWNEANIDRTWVSGEISGAAYVEMLRQAYQAIKAANDEVMVISAAPAPTGAEAAFPGQVMNDDHWIQEVVGAGGLAYMDCLGAHYVEGVVAPDQRLGDPRDDHYTRYFTGMIDTYSTLMGGARPICFTAFGYLTSEGYDDLSPFFQWAQNTTVAQQAAWLADTTVMADVSDQVRLLIIWNIDFTTYNADDPTAGYAIVRADGSCPACAALFDAQSGMQAPIAASPPNITVQSDELSDGRISIRLPADSATFVWAFISEVDVVVSMYFVDVIDMTPMTNSEPQLATQRTITNAQIVLNDDGSINLVMSPDDAVIMVWILEARMPFMIIPTTNSDEATTPVVYPPTDEGGVRRFVIDVPASAVTSSIAQLQNGAPVDVDVTLEIDGSQGYYRIEDAVYRGVEGDSVLIAVSDSANAGVLSWVEQGGFSVNITEAQP